MTPFRFSAILSLSRRVVDAFDVDVRPRRHRGGGVHEAEEHAEARAGGKRLSQDRGGPPRAQVGGRGPGRNVPAGTNLGVAQAQHEQAALHVAARRHEEVATAVHVKVPVFRHRAHRGPERAVRGNRHLELPHVVPGVHANVAAAERANALLEVLVDNRPGCLLRDGRGGNVALPARLAVAEEPGRGGLRGKRGGDIVSRIELDVTALGGELPERNACEAWRRCGRPARRVDHGSDVARGGRRDEGKVLTCMQGDVTGSRPDHGVRL